MSTRTSMNTRNNYSSKSSRNFGFTGQDQDENDYLDPSSSSFSASGDGSKKTNVNALDIAILNIQDCLQIASIINNNANMFDKYL
ncbi:hypothetical protein AX774_g1161 [Zancudomyces culisetae]|uniref:Uncharacterized protein n=1 Tax=Zancudomyces culisetae TaxID=1213189 RepID=A0A1R1PWK2_ZANCU|nr:hypothetical protein AX774_g1161 [Zancudomyces culisetae]|eukprot:OMH85283.1 hypothetical protein AX774_g1161 [Zancudomyces culisetae]